MARQWPVPLARGRREVVARVVAAALQPGGRALLLGEPGIGKSTVLSAALERAAASGALVLTIQGANCRTGDPFMGVIDLLSDIPLASLEALPGPQRAAVQAALAQTVPEHPVPPMALAVGVATVIAEALGRAPLVLAIDDLQWLDVESAQIVRYVIKRPGLRDSIAVLATRRTDSLAVDDGSRADPPDSEVFPPADQVVLEGLDAADLAYVVSAQTGQAPSSADSERLHEWSAGNPLWALELVDQLARPGRSRTIPRSVEDAVRARLGTLDPAVTEVLATVAAVSNPPPSLVVSLVHDGADALDRALDEGLVHEQDGQLRPAHPLLGQAALERWSRWELRELHARIAEQLTDPHRRTHHEDLARPPGADEELAAALDAWARAARARGAVPTALSVAERALARTPATSLQRNVRAIALGGYAFAAGDFTRTAALLEEIDFAAIEVADLDRALPLVLSAISATRGEEAAVTALDAIEIAASPDPVHRAVLAAYRSEVGTTPPEERQRSAVDAVAVLAAASVAPVTRHRALGSLLSAKLDAGDGLDLSLLREIELIENDLELLSINDGAEAQRGLYSYQVEDLASSRLHLRRTVQRAEAIGEELIAGLFSVHLALVEILAGHRSDADQWLSRFDAIDPWPDTPPPSVVAAKGLMAIVDGDEAALQALVSMPQGPGSETYGHVVRLALNGISAARRAEWTTAYPFLLQARTAADMIGVRDPGRRLWIDLDLADTQYALGRADEAADTVAWIEQVIGQSASPRPKLTAGLARVGAAAALAEGRLDEAEKHARSALHTLSSYQFPVDECLSLIILAQVLLGAARPREAADALLRAERRADGIGHRPLGIRVRRLLVEVQEQASMPADLGLTPAELRIAEAVAEGRTNKQIAALHFLSVRTVETHLSTIYRKLDLSTRSQLVALLREQQQQRSR